MARSLAANASARVVSRVGLATPIAQKAYEKKLRNEYRIRKALPLLLLIFVGSTIYSAMTQINLGRAQAFDQAARELQQLAVIKATLLRKTAVLSLALRDLDPHSRALLEPVGAQFTRFVIVDGSNAILDTNVQGPLEALQNDLLAHAASARAEGSVFFELGMIGGSEAMIHAVSIDETRRLVLFKPVSEVLSRWTTRTWGLATLLITSLVALLTICVAYLQQMSRTGDTDAICGMLGERLETSLTRGGCGLWDWDTGARTMNWSLSLQHLLGVESEGMGRPVADFTSRLHPDDRAFFDLIGEAAARRESTVDHEIRMLHADGAWRWFRMRADYLPATGARGGHMVGTAVDITALKQNEAVLLHKEDTLRQHLEEKEAHRAKLVEKTRMLGELAERYRAESKRAEAASVSKSLFLANMSHELRTPLNAIIGFAQVIEQGLFGPVGSHRYEVYVRDIRKSGESLLTVVNDLLDMSNIEAGRVTPRACPFVLAEAVDEVIAAGAEAAAVRGLTVVVSVDRDVVVNADRRLVCQTIAQITGNAVKFAGVGGQVKVRLRRRGGRCRLSIVDDGPGMSRDTLGRIGRPFEQHHNRLSNGMKGSGLGLAIAKALTDLHGGALRIASRAGRGTCVSIELPCLPGLDQTAPTRLENASLT
jgi:PAS domain S-box-containing protein